MICNFKTKVWFLCYVGVSPNYMIHPLDISNSFSMDDCGGSTQTKSLLQEPHPGCFVYKLSAPSVWLTMNLASPIKEARTTLTNTL